MNPLQPDLPFTTPEPICGFHIDAFNESPVKVAEIAKSFARDVFCESGTLPLVTLVYGQKLPLWYIGKALPTHDLVWLIVLKQSTEQSKAQLALAMPYLLSMLGAVGVAVMYESWSVPFNADDPNDAILAYKREHGTIAGAPGVSEVLYCTWETKSLVTGWMAPIYRTPKMGARVGCFEQMEGTVEGRFAHMLVDLNPATQA